MMASLLELISENQLHDEIVGALRQAEADAKVELEPWGQVQVNSGKNLVLDFVIVLAAARQDQKRHDATGGQPQCERIPGIYKGYHATRSTLHTGLGQFK